MTGPAANPRAPGSGGGQVTRLWVHPLKGARATALRTMEFDALGPRWDRRWMVVRPGGGMVTQRDTPRLAVVHPQLDNGALRLEAEGMESLILPTAPLGDPVGVTIHGNGAVGSAVSPDADAWLSTVLGRDVRLIFMREEDARPTDPAYAEGRRVSFADGFPALLVSERSVEELARRSGRGIPAERFRPNIVVTGAHPHDEDRWQRFTVGGMGFSGVKLCTRCKVTTTDQRTGVRDPDREPLRTLALYRRIESAVYFGVNVVHDGPGRIAVGDRVEVLERGIIPGAGLGR